MTRRIAALATLTAAMCLTASCSILTPRTGHPRNQRRTHVHRAARLRKVPPSNRPVKPHW